jgi:TadE-like protein
MNDRSYRVTRLPRRSTSSSGQSLVEFAIVLPLLLVLVLAVIETGYALLDAHIVTKLTREGSNMISRDTSLNDCVTAMRSMSSRPVNFDDGSSTLILSVIRLVATTGAINYNKPVLYQRYKYGSFAASSVLATVGGGSFGGAPDYKAANSDNDSNLQVTNLPANLLIVPGDMIYVTEIYSRHTLITPVDRLGITLPRTLYAIAYF